MSKYIDAEKLKALVKRQIRQENFNFAALGGGGQTFCTNTLEWVLKQIDSIQQEQPESSNGKFVFPNFLYARTVDNKTIDVSYAPQSMDAVEYLKNNPIEQPEVDLKKEIKEWVNLMVGASFPEQDGDFISEEDYRSVIKQTALHFYELGKNSK